MLLLFRHEWDGEKEKEKEKKKWKLETEMQEHGSFIVHDMLR